MFCSLDLPIFLNCTFVKCQKYYYPFSVIRTDLHEVSEGSHFKFICLPIVGELKNFFSALLISILIFSNESFASSVHTIFLACQ
jgi:hypothetical protein